MCNSYRMVFTERLILLAQLGYLLLCIMVCVVSIIGSGCRHRCSIDIILHISSQIGRKCFLSIMNVVQEILATASTEEKMEILIKLVAYPLDR